MTSPRRRKALSAKFNFWRPARTRRYIALAFGGALCALVYCLTLSSPAHAFITLQGGDGYIPIIYGDRIFNIYHHQSVSANPSSPNYDINCVERITGAVCSGYPRYFSTTNGSTGSLTIGTAGTPDIYTTRAPRAVIEGTKLFYPAQTTTSNGVGCFDLSAALNCGYTQLGSLAWTGVNTTPAKIDGLERIGNKLYSIGADINMYCLDISTPSSPVACTSQPYAVNTGITGTMPTYNGISFNSQREVINGNIYFVINYATQSPAIDSRVTCFDPNTTARCAGWTSADAPNALSGTNLYHTIFSYLNTSGVSQAVCVTQRLIDPILCFDLTTGASASAPNVFSLAPAGKSNYVFEELTVGTKAYFPIGWPAGTTSAALCWDFATQGACSGFGTNGYKPWDGSDGGTAVNGGDTRDYGYAVFQGCMYGFGDAGVLWSFDATTGAVPGSASCAVAGGETTSSTPAASPGLPNAGDSPQAKGTPWLAISAAALVSAPAVRLLRRTKFVSNRP